MDRSWWKSFPREWQPKVEEEAWIETVMMKNCRTSIFLQHDEEFCEVRSNDFGGVGIKLRGEGEKKE